MIVSGGMGRYDKRSGGNHNRGRMGATVIGVGAVMAREGCGMVREAWFLTVI